MFNFLSEKFIKDYKNTDNPEVRLKLISLSSSISIVLNIILAISKLLIGLIANSASIINDAFNNLSDTIVAILAFLGSKLSRKPADKEHPHGHGRMEFLVSMLVGILIMYVGFQLFLNSIGKFKEDNFVKMNFTIALILILSILAKIYIYILNRRLYFKLDSELNYGVMVDSRNDILSTLAIIISLYIQKYVDFNVDAVAGIFLSVAVFIPGFNMFKDTVNYLVGERINPEIEEKISNILLDNDFIVGFHNLEIHEYGKGHVDGSVDVEIAQNLSLLVAHMLITDIQKRIKEEVGIKLSIHMDPTYTLIIDDDIKKQIEILEKKAKYDYEDF